MRRLIVVALVATLTVLSACGSDSDDKSSSSSNVSSTGGSAGDSTGGATGGASLALADIATINWIADSKTTGTDTQPLAVGASFFIDASGNIQLNTGCNTATGVVTSTAPNVMTVGPLAMTQMACTDPAVQELESTLVKLFTGDVAFNGNEATLSMNAVADPTVIINFAKAD